MQKTIEKLKVGYVIGEFGIGGAERQLLSKLVSLRKLEVDSFVVALSEGGNLVEEYREAGARIYQIPRSHSLEVGRIPQLVKIMRAEQPHIVQGEQYDAGTYARVAAVVAGVPVRILAIRSTYTNLRSRYLFTETFLKRFTHAYIVNAQAIKDRTLAHHGVEADRVHVIDNIYSHDPATTRSASEMRRELGLDDVGPVIGIVASFSPEKNHRMFLEFAQRLSVEHPNARFVLIGDGNRRGEIEATIAELGIGEQTLLLGVRRDVYDLLQVLDFSVNTSFREGQNNAILESVFSGIPVLASRVGGTPEIVTPGVQGELFDVASLDDMVRQGQKLLGNLETYRTEMERGREQFVQRFDASRVTEHLCRIYAQRLIERGFQLPRQKFLVEERATS